MNRFIVLIVLLLSVALLSCLSLEESIEMALRNNLLLQANAQEISIADQLYREVTSALLPQISLTGGYQVSRTELPQSYLPPAIDVTGQLSDTAGEDDKLLAGVLEQGFNSFIPNQTSDESSYFAQVQLNQVVYLGGKLLSGIRAANIYKTIESQRYELAKQNLIYNITDLYYQGLLLIESLDITKESLELAEKHYERVTSMFEQGLVSEFDTIRAELELAKLQPLLQQVENSYSLWLENFRNYLNLPADEEITLTGSIQLEEKEEPNLNEALTTAKESRIELYVSRAFRDLREINWRAERGNFLPNVALTAEYNRFSNRNKFSLEPNDFGSSYQVMLGFQLPIFTGFGNSAKAAQARHQYKRAELEHLDLENKIELDVRRSYQTLLFAQKNYTAQQNRINLAERGLTIASARYENQIGINLEVLDAQLEYRISRLAYLQSVYEMIMAHKNLQKTMGIALR